MYLNDVFELHLNSFLIHFALLVFKLSKLLRAEVVASLLTESSKHVLSSLYYYLCLMPRNS